jgi:hypothetical protein
MAIHKCAYCNYESNRKGNTERHIYLVHNIKEKINRYSKLQYNDNISIEHHKINGRDVVQYRCKKCKDQYNDIIIFTKSTNIIKHIEHIHNNETNKIINDNITYIDYNKSVLYCCNNCLKQFDKLHLCILHIKKEICVPKRIKLL